MQFPVQPAKFDVSFGSAVSMSIDPLKMLCEQVPVGVPVPFKTQSIIVPVPPIEPVTVPPPVEPVPGPTFNVKFPVPLVNIAVICSFWFTVTIQVVLVAGHCVSPIVPPHPANTDPGLGVSVKVTVFPLGYVVLQVPVVPWPPASVQLICCGTELSVTVPYATPSSTT